MEHFKVGERVVLRKFPQGTRGEVVHVPDDGLLIRVKWTGWPGDSRESTHNPVDLARVLTEARS
jgi:hypothetical protein